MTDPTQQGERVSTTNDPDGYAELWLAELGAHVPEWRRGAAADPLEHAFGLDLDQRERARRHGQHLAREQHRAWSHRARVDPDPGA